MKGMLLHFLTLKFGVSIMLLYETSIHYDSTAVPGSNTGANKYWKIIKWNQEKCILQFFPLSSNVTCNDFSSWLRWEYRFQQICISNSNFAVFGATRFCNDHQQSTNTIATSVWTEFGKSLCFSHGHWVAVCGMHIISRKTFRFICVCTRRKKKILSIQMQFNKYDLTEYLNCQTFLDKANKIT